MSIRIWAKKETQAFLRRMRKDGVDVRKEQDGLYKGYVEGELCFTALNMGRFYTIRLHDVFFTEEEA